MPDIFRRSITFQPKWREASPEGDTKNEPRSLSILASTADPVDWGGWREVLQHDEGCIDGDAARALLLNHDPNRLCGRITKRSLGDDGQHVEAELLPGASLESGVSVEDAVDSGALRGVSIGYSYDRSDAEFDEDTRTLTVRKWRLLEVSLTPIPADARAMVRSLPFKSPTPIPRNAPVKFKITLARFLALAAAFAHIPQTALAERSQIVDADSEDVLKGERDLRAWAESQPDPSRDERARAAALTEAREVAEMARSVGLDAADYAGISKAEAQAKMMRALGEKNKTKEPEQHAISITTDAVDKARDAMVGAMTHAAGFRDKATMEAVRNNPMAGRGIQHMVRKFARMNGENPEDWSRQDVAWYALGKRELMSGARTNGNVSSGMLPNFVFLNAITKIVDKGFEMAEANVRYPALVSDNTVPDFKQFSIGSLGVGNLVRTAEGIPFPELDKSEGVYNSTAKMWGGTMCLTFEALVNDDTGEFNRHLRMAGTIARKTIDRRVFQKLLMGTSTAETTSTWTSNTISGCSPVWTTADTLAAARAKVNTGIVALMNKTGKDGNPLGTMPRFFVGGPTVGAYLVGLQQSVSGQTVGNSFAGMPEVIVTPWLEATALAGNSTTTFYVLGDPNSTTGLVLTKLMGYDGVQVMPFDSGATAGLNWKLWLPFEADLVSQTYTPPAPSGSVGTSTTVIAAAQQCTT